MAISRRMGYSDEYVWTMDGRLIPRNIYGSNPVYSRKAKKLAKQIREEEKKFYESMCGEVKTYKLGKEPEK